MVAKSPSTKEVKAVFDYWNRKEIVKHRTMTDAHVRKIRTVLKDYDVVEVCKAIFNYANILHGKEFYWTYRWTIKDFLQRGLERFMDSAYPYDNFKSSYPVEPDKPAPAVSNEHKERFARWKNASPEERKKLEAEWREQL